HHNNTLISVPSQRCLAYFYEQLVAHSTGPLPGLTCDAGVQTIAYSPRNSVWEESRMGFGVQLRSAREAAGLSQRELADKSGIALDSIQNWEQGRTNPRLPALSVLAAALGVSLDTLIVGDGSKDKGKRSRGRPRKVAEAAPAVKKKATN